MTDPDTHQSPVTPASSVPPAASRWLRAARRIRGGASYVLGERHPFGIPRLDYDLYWQARGIHGVVARFPIIADFLHRGETLLDIGCGEGAGLGYLSEKAGIEGHGVDISSVAIDIAAQRGLNVAVADAMSPDFKLTREYDTVLISEVLEHVAEPELLLRNVRHHIRRRLILTFPNVAYLPHRLRLLFGRFPVQWGWHPGEHLRFWSLSDFVWWLDQLGYDIETVRASNGIRGLARAWPSLFGNQIVVVAHPRSEA